MTPAFSLLGLAASAAAVAQGPATLPAVSLSTNPPTVCADDSSSGHPNFDIVVRNGTDRPLTISEIKAKSFDPQGALLEQRILWQDALAILGPSQITAAGAEGLVFNPFRLATAGPGARIAYDVSFRELAAPITLTVNLVSCVTKARLTLPLAGRLLVYDGYDFLSHHRRQTYQTRADLKAFGIVDNSFRFGIDLLPIDAEGRMFRGDGSKIEQWLGWGMAVRAAGDGVVTAVRDDMPDNALGSEDYPKKRLSEDEMNSDGNYVLIDHGGGEFSAATHLKYGSAKVRQGERVRAGQIIAAIGNSGATPVPHLHYELRSGFGVRGVRSMPPYFHDLDVVGRPRANGPLAINTGDVVIAR